MRKFISQFSTIISFYCLLLIISSCKDEGDTPKTDKPASSDSKITDANKDKESTATLIGGTLDTLWISSTDFPANPEKIIFTFTIDQNDKLKLHGWKVKGGTIEFDPTPNYQLMNAGQHKGSTYGPNMYFGSIVLKRPDVKIIRDKINQGNYTKVLFVPKITNGHIGYDIFVGKDDGQQVSILAVAPTGTEANPSPPKNYN